MSKTTKAKSGTKPKAKSGSNSQSTKAKARGGADPHSVVWFEIPADDPTRAQRFYGSLFGWKIQAFPGMEAYWHVDTGGDDASPDAGMLPRMHETHTITNYVLVPSVTRFMAKVEKLGGAICKPKTAVPGMGYFAICRDTEKNTFALWEVNTKAK
jgi:predicted enzyme related to lactoylglutathione lyase